MSTSRFVKKADVATVSPRLTALFTSQKHGDASEIIRAQELAPLHTLQIKLIRQRTLGTPAVPGGPRTVSTLDFIQQYFDAENTLVARRVASANIDTHLAGILGLVSTEQVPLARQMLRELLSRSRLTAEGLTLNSWNWLRVIFSRHRADPEATVGKFRDFMGPEIDKSFAGNSFKYDVKLIDAGVSPGIDIGIFELGLTGVKVEILKSRTDGIGGTNTIRLEGGYGQLGIGWSPEALDFLGEAGGGTGGDEVTAYSNIDYTEQSLAGPLMILGGSAGIGVGVTSASVGPSALFMYGNRTLPPLAFPLPFTSTGDNEIRLPSIEATFATGYLFTNSAVVDPGQYNLSTEPISQSFSAQGTAQGSVYFDVNQAILRTCGWVGLRELVAEYRAICENEGATISVLGFADATGTDVLNDDLSQRRADSVKTALVNIIGPGRGVPLERIRAIGLGRKPALGQTPTRDAQLNEVERDFIALKRQELGTLQPNQADQRWRSVSILLNNLIKVDLRTPGTP
jgi:outer membrane protein OmpA-like peptidoglycan-associated protein